MKTHFYAKHPEVAPEQLQEQLQEQQQVNSDEIQYNKRRSSNLIDELLNPSHVDFPAPDQNDHLLVGRFNVTKAFHMLQLSICQHK